MRINELYEAPPWLKNAETSNADVEIIKNGVIWKSGTWHSGTWVDGVWQSGDWFDGTWQTGLWLKGNHWHGTWVDGDWYRGTWDGGEWLGGVWHRGTWRGAGDAPPAPNTDTAEGWDEKAIRLKKPPPSAMRLAYDSIYRTNTDKTLDTIPHP